jgi:WD40 repeat protein
MDWHPSGRWLATADLSGAVQLIDSQSGETRLLGRHKAEAARVAFHPDGRYLISGGWERELICWDVKAMQRAFTVPLGSYDLRFRADGRECAIAIETPRRVLVHALESPAAHREFTEDLGVRLRSAAFSTDGRWLAASAAGRSGVWDLNNTAAGAMAKGGDQARVGFSASGELFVQRAGECSRWLVIPGTNASAPPRLEQLTLDVTNGFVSLSLLADSVVMTTSNGSQVAVLDRHNGQSNEWKRTANGRNTVSPDGRWLAVHPSYRMELGIYHLPDLQLTAVLTNEFRIGPFQFSPRSDEIAAASQHGIEFWSTTTWQRTRVVTNFTDILYAPDGRSFWLTKDYDTAGLYDSETLEPLLPLPGGTLPLAVSPDGRRLAVSVDMRRLQVWDLGELREHLRKSGLDWSNKMIGNR